MVKKTKKKNPGGRKITSRDGGIRRKRPTRFSDAEWNWMHRAARAEGLTLSAFMRKRVLRGMPIENPHAEM